MSNEIKKSIKDDFLISLDNDYVTVVRGNTWFTLKNLIMIEDKLTNPIKDGLFRFTIMLHIIERLWISSKFNSRWLAGLLELSFYLGAS